MPFLQKLFSPPDLAMLETQQDVKGLIKALGHKDAAVRQSASLSLEKIGTPAVELPFKALQDPSWQVSAQAYKTLERTGNLSFAEAMVRIAALKAHPEDFHHDYPYTPAAQALERMGAPAVEPLIKTLQDPNWQVRASVALILGRLGDARAVAPGETWTAKIPQGVYAVFASANASTPIEFSGTVLLLRGYDNTWLIDK
jgi:HEAT repeat protein